MKLTVDRRAARVSVMNDGGRPVRGDLTHCRQPTLSVAQILNPEGCIRVMVAGHCPAERLPESDGRLVESGAELLGGADEGAEEIWLVDGVVVRDEGVTICVTVELW